MSGNFFSEGRTGLFCSFQLMTDDVGNSAAAGSLPESDLTFDELYEHFATDVLRVAYYYLGDKQRAEDVTQDVFVRYLQNRPVLFAGREKSWLLKVALNRCRDLWRSAWLKKVVLGHPSFELFPADDEIGRAADSIALAEAVNSLAPDFKEVVLLHYYQGYGVSEIAGMLDIAEGTVSSRLSRARSKLMKELGNEHGKI
jgi:RNA polymerase sigma-70 factor (ECF subfamily)